MIKKLLFLFILTSISVSNAQIGINTTTIDNGVMLQIDSNDSGILIPRINLNGLTDTTTIPAPITNGTLIYNITNNLTLQEGFYFWQNTSWILISASGNDNIYNTNGTLNGNRFINQGVNYIQLDGIAGKNALTLRRDDNEETTGIAFRNSGDFYDATIYMESPNSTRLVFASGGNDANIDNIGRTLTLNDDSSIAFDEYGAGNNTGTATQILAVDTKGNVIEQPINRGVQFYSYNLATPTASPDLNLLERNTKINRSGAYTGSLDNVTAMKPSNSDGFVIKIVGTYEVQNTGDFTFEDDSDDGARIYIDGALVLNEWTDSGTGHVNSATVTLAKGKHKFEFWYYENAGGESFSYSWGTNPDGNSGVINATQFTVE